MSNPWQALRAAWRRRREEAAIARRPIPDRLWRRTEFSGAHGLRVTDDMAVAIAAQACLPVLHLGLQAYDDFIGIVVHPGQARVRRETVDDAGVVHVGDEILSGEAVKGGPVMLSWRDVRASGASAGEGYNVVIHEFAHVLDMADGEPNGRPPLPVSLDAARWDETLAEAYDALCARVDAGEPTVLDPYGTTSIDEFFAVASEAFFVHREGLLREHPRLDRLLAAFYRFPPIAPG